MTSISVRAELIILATPTNADDYYADVEDNIFDFHIAYAKQIARHDDVLILTDKIRYNDYVQVLGKDRVIVAPMLDIWMRDFTLVNPEHPLMFRYTAAGQGGGRQGQTLADMVQQTFVHILKEAGLPFTESDLLNDGGNFVEDGAGNVVMSTKFLTDNGLSEKEARRRLLALPGIRAVAFIEADEQGGLEHADGVVSFVDKNKLIINSYPDDAAYARQLKADIKRGLPDVEIYEITAPYDGNEIYDERFGSACGLYTNALVTPERIYLPQFGIAEDKIALRQVRAITDKQLIPVQSQGVCIMGGGVRCMSWQLRGVNARKFLDYFDMQ